jgi:two-component system chemotaxis sensor kinase CheA
VALILDVLGVGQSAGVLTEMREQARAASQQKTQETDQKQRLLLFRAGSFERLAVPLSRVARLEEFPRSLIERAGGCDVVQYRGRILPLIPIRMVLEGIAEDRSAAPEKVQVVVVNDGDRSVGLVVDQILDVAEEVVTAQRNSSRKGLLGSCVVGKRVTDMVDLNAVLQADTCDSVEPAAALAYAGEER